MLFSVLLFYCTSKSINTLKDYKATIIALNLSSYNFLADIARFKLSKEAECLLGSIFKDPDPFMV